MKKLTIKKIIIIVLTVLLLLSTTMIISGILGQLNIIKGMNGAGVGILFAAAIILLLFLITFIVLKFITRKKYVCLSQDEIKNINASKENLPTDLALYILLNPSLANKQGFVLGGFKLV